MIYELPPKGKGSQLSPWYHIFSTIAWSGFDEIYSDLDFPVYPSPELKDIALQFLVLFYQTLKRPIPDAVPVKPIFSVNQAYEEKVELAWTHTFSQLEDLKLAEIVYTWGMRSYRMQKGVMISSLHALANLLRQYVIQRWGDKAYDFGEMTPCVLDDWTYMYPKVRENPFPSFSLSTHTHNQICEIVFAHDSKYTEIEELIKQTSPKNQIDEFVFYEGTIGGIWIKNDAQYRIHLREWKQILSVLSLDELAILEKWTMEQKQTLKDKLWVDDLIIPFPSFD